MTTITTDTHTITASCIGYYDEGIKHTELDPQGFTLHEIIENMLSQWNAAEDSDGNFHVDYQDEQATIILGSTTDAETNNRVAFDIRIRATKNS